MKNQKVISRRCSLGSAPIAATAGTKGAAETLATGFRAALDVLGKPLHGPHSKH